MTPLNILADATDIYTARTVMEALRKAGWIVVRHDAIERAQREAVVQYKEDRMREPYPPPPADWDNKRAA